MVQRVRGRFIIDEPVIRSEIADDAIDGTKIADNAINSEHYTNASIDLQHLAADSVDGSKIVDDAVDSEHVAAGALDAEHFTDGSITRARMIQDDLKPYPIALSTFMAVDGAAMAVSEDSSDLYRSVSGNIHTLLGRTPASATEAAAAVTQFALPAEYVSGETITVRIKSQFINGSGADSSRDSFTDLEVFKQAAGAIGSDICATNNQSPTADDTYETFNFTVTPTGLVAGDILNLLITLSCVGDDGNPTQLQLGEVIVLCDVKG